MSVNISQIEIKIDGVDRNDVFDNYQDGEGFSFSNSFDNGYYPLDENRDRMSEEEILSIIAKDYPESTIFFRIINDYGEYAYEYKNGKVREMKKEWH